MKIVVSAFEPFGGRDRNRSLELLNHLAAQLLLETHVLPVCFAELSRCVTAIADTAPDFWLMLGESEKAQALHFERRAHNSIEARIPDNKGQQPRGCEVEPGPETRDSKVKLGRLLNGLRILGIPARASYDAGRFACNAAYYLALSRLPSERVIFVHVPAEVEHGSDALLCRGLRTLLNQQQALTQLRRVHAHARQQKAATAPRQRTQPTQRRPGRARPSRSGSRRRP
jgi:pyrrolidone-carboxylate peptidase